MSPSPRSDTPLTLCITGPRAGACQPSNAVLPPGSFHAQHLPGTGSERAARRGLPGPPQLPSVPPRCRKPASSVVPLAGVSLGDGQGNCGQAEEERGQPQHFGKGDFIPRRALFALLSCGSVCEGARGGVRDVAPRLEFLPRHFFENVFSLDNKCTRQTS